MELSADEYDYEDVTDVNNDGKHVLRPEHPVSMMLKRVLRRIIDLMELPPNPLDDLVHHLYSDKSTDDAPLTECEVYMACWHRCPAFAILC